MSQCVADSTDQSSRFIDEVLEAADLGVPLILPAGVINLSGISTPISVSGLRLATIYGDARLDAGTAKYFSLFNVTGGDIDCERVVFRLWDKPVISSAALGLFRMRSCGLLENRGHVTLLDRSDYPLSSADVVILENNWCLDSPGLEIKGAIGEAHAVGNRFRRVRRSPTYWDHTQNHRLYAICLGDHDDVPPSIAQHVTRKITMRGNVVRGVDNQSASGITTNGLVAVCEELDLCHNIIEDINSPGNPYDCEGIYIKSMFGQVAHNYLTDATRESCAIAVKGKSYGAPIAKALRVHHNQVRAVNSVNALGVTVFGSATDVTVENNEFYELKDGAVVIYGSPVRNHVRDNKAVRCGGIPIYYSCGDVTDCDVSRNEVVDQVMPSPSDVARLFNPYPDSGTFVASGVYVKAVAGQVPSFTVTDGGDGYAVNGSPTGTCYVSVTGGVGGAGTGAYAVFVDGVLVSVIPTSAGSGWTTAPTVMPLTSAQAGITITNSGSPATVTTQLSAGAMIDLTAYDNRFRGTYQYDAAKPVRNYECVSLSNNSSALTNNTVVDGVDAKINGAWDGANPFYIAGVGLYGASFGSGQIDRIKMHGSNSGRRQHPWRVNNSSIISRFSTLGAQLYLGPASVDAGMMLPQSTCFLSPGRARLTISFERFFAAASTYLGSLVGGAAEGKVRITKVSPRYVLQSGGSALAAASGVPTVALGTGSGLSNLIVATAIGSMTTVASPVDGATANEVSPSGSDADIYLTIAGGAIAANSKAYLVVDVDYTVLI